MRCVTCHGVVEQNNAGTLHEITEPKKVPYVPFTRIMRLSSGMFDDVRRRRGGRQEAEMYSAVCRCDRTITRMYHVPGTSLGSVSRIQPKLASYVLLIRIMRLSSGMFDDVRRRRGGRQEAEMYSAVIWCERTIRSMYNMSRTSLGSVSRTQPKLASYVQLTRRIRLSGGMFDDVIRGWGGRQEAEMGSAMTRGRSTMRLM
jgi:hypothetical protein